MEIIKKVEASFITEIKIIKRNYLCQKPAMQNSKATGINIISG